MRIFEYVILVIQHVLTFNKHLEIILDSVGFLTYTLYSFRWLSGSGDIQIAPSPTSILSNCLSDRSWTTVEFIRGIVTFRKSPPEYSPTRHWKILSEEFRDSVSTFIRKPTSGVNPSDTSLESPTLKNHVFYNKNWALSTQLLNWIEELGIRPGLAHIDQLWYQDSMGCKVECTFRRLQYGRQWSSFLLHLSDKVLPPDLKRFTYYANIQKLDSL